MLGWALVCAGVEGVEALSGFWGVKRRGGSAWAGVAALLGAFAGLLAGALIPVPVLGSLLGMLAGGFLLAYAVERRRLKSGGRAAHIATGTVLARLSMLLLKVSVALVMSVWLLLGLLDRGAQGS